MLDFIYSDKLEIEAESWGPLVKMADVLQMGTLYTKCVEAIGIGVRDKKMIY